MEILRAFGGMLAAKIILKCDKKNKLRRETTKRGETNVYSLNDDLNFRHSLPLIFILQPGGVVIICICMYLRCNRSEC